MYTRQASSRARDPGLAAETQVHLSYFRPALSATLIDFARIYGKMKHVYAILRRTNASVSIVAFPNSILSESLIHAMCSGAVSTSRVPS
jgi:hypothetical protein